MSSIVCSWWLLLTRHTWLDGGFEALYFDMLVAAVEFVEAEIWLFEFTQLVVVLFVLVVVDLLSAARKFPKGGERGEKAQAYTF